MLEIIKELDVDVTKPNLFQAIVAKQYDMNTRFLKVTFKDSGTRIDIPQLETAKVIINAERRDGLAKGFDGVINDDGTVTVPLHSWMLELDGTVICDISVIDMATDDNKKLTTTSFTLFVEKAAYGREGITNDPQYDILIELLEMCGDAEVLADEALVKSNEAISKIQGCEEAAARANEAADVAFAAEQNVRDGGFIESMKEMNKGSKFKVWVGTQEEYAALAKKPNNTFCIITDDITEENLFSTMEDLETRVSNIGVALNKNMAKVQDMRRLIFYGALNDGETGDINVDIREIPTFHFMIATVHYNYEGGARQDVILTQKDANVFDGIAEEVGFSDIDSGVLCYSRKVYVKAIFEDDGKVTFNTCFLETTKTMKSGNVVDSTTCTNTTKSDAPYLTEIYGYKITV